MRSRESGPPKGTPTSKSGSGVGANFGTGKVLLERGKNFNMADPTVEPAEDIDRLMYLLNLNLQHRIKKRGKGKSNHDKLQGLFGGR